MLGDTLVAVRVIVTGLIVGIALAGCIEAGLTSCPDVVCPAGTACGPGGGCVFVEQLTVCEGAGELAPCSFRGTDGVCQGGACIPFGCGNRQITSDEVCDDGNTNNGDGCSADCRSDETCGNGVTDIAAGEQCDDGNETPGDGCEPGCKLPSCGDTFVDGLEECDPAAAALVTTRTCDDFGYYAGNLSCNSLCRLDPTVTCTGRCGDVVVQTAHEECDGGPPVTTCVDEGYDLGALVCTASCTADRVGSCDRFGWVHLGGSSIPMDLTGDGDTQVQRGNSVMFVTGPFGTVTKLGFYTDADVLGTTVLAATSTTVELAINGVFQTLPPPPLPPDTEIAEVVLADDGTPMILATAPAGSGIFSCYVGGYIAGTWTGAAQPTFCEHLTAIAADNYAFVASATAVRWMYPGGTRLESTQKPVYTLKLRGSQLDIYVYDQIALDRITVPTVGPGPGGGADLLLGNFAKIVIVGGVPFAIDPQSFNTTLYRGGDGGRIETTAGPPSVTGAPSDLYVTRDGVIYGNGDSQLYRLGALTPTRRLLPTTGDVTTLSRVALGVDNSLVMCSRDVWLASGTSYQKLSTTLAAECTALYVNTKTDLYAGRKIGTTMQLFWWGSSWIEQLYQGNPIAARQLAGSGSTVIALLMDGTILRKSGVWSALPALPAGCTAQSVAVGAGGIYAAGSCLGNPIWRLTGATWTEVQSGAAGGPWASLYIAPDATVFAAGGSAVVLHGKEGGPWQTDANAAVVLAGVSATEVYGIIPTAGSTKGIRQWNGANRWTPIRRDPSLSVTLIAANATDLIAVAGVYPQPNATAWLGFLLEP